MPITKDNDGHTVVEMGVGDVFVGDGLCQEDRELLFIEKHFSGVKIGDEMPEMCGKSTTDYNNVVRVKFLKVESIDVIIHRLVLIRAAMSWPNQTDNRKSESQ
jgi:hypothetical protein